MSQQGETLSLTRSRSRSSDHNERLEPRLLRAAESDDVDLLRQIIDAAKVKGQLNENFLRIGLIRSSEKGKIRATEFLLSKGALPDGAPGNRLPPLLRAVERNNIEILQLLLKHGANTNVSDKKGRTALMTAAWYNHYHVLNSLIARGADIHATDQNGRTVLHNLAADKKCAWGNSVIELLLNQNIDIEAQDKLGRTALHWACATGKLPLAEQFLTRPKGPKANIHAVDGRGKSGLHLAITHDRDDIVDMLLKYGADVHAKSDGSWTPLHNACEVGSLKISQILLKEGADCNAHLLNGMTPLHVASQSGHVECVRLLLQQPGIKRSHRDAFGFTPFLRAAQNKRKDIVSLLAPSNLVEKLSEDALGACNGFNATIVDFGNFRNENRVTRPTVFELLYARDTVNQRKQKLTILPNDKAADFRWIHLPANNMAWIEVLLTKLFIEENASDVEGFKALERSFSHQHRGQQSHSHFMRPLCQSTPRASREQSYEEEPPQEAPVDPGPPTIVINGSFGSPSRSPTLREDSSDLFKSSPQLSGKENAKQKEKGKKPQAKGNKSPKGFETPSKDRQHNPKVHQSQRPRSPASPGHRIAPQHTKGNIFTFMPYLHFESTMRRQEMEEAIKRAEILRSTTRRPLERAKTFDEMLIRAHLATSTVSLHVRRTLDQSFYHNIDTSSRDQDQVVYRYQMKESSPSKSQTAPSPNCDPKIVMVDQLWLWILGPNLILTSFPQRWQQPKNDPLNVLDAIIEDINSKTREPVHSVYDLAMIITNRCTGVFNRHRMGDENYQFLDMFESSIGSATDRETVLFKEFNAASAQASAWLQHHRRPNRFSRYLDSSGAPVSPSEAELSFDSSIHGPLFVDKLLDIGQETDLLAETKDIRDELNMIAKVLSDQLIVLPDLQECICDIYRDSSKSQVEVKKRFRDQLKTIETHINDIARMDRQAERIYKSITDMLDLKQKHANAFEARFARDQAAGTARQSQTIMVFTIVTIIFLPLSFIAAFFAINIKEFPRNEQGPSLPLSYVSKWLFGIGFSVSIPLIAVALLLDDIRDFVRHLKDHFARWKLERQGNGDREHEKDLGLQLLKIQQAISVAKSTRMSVDTEWIGRISLANGRVETRERDIERDMEREKMATGFRMRNSRDLERGSR